MNALIDVNKKAGCNLQELNGQLYKNEGKEVLKKKIEESIMQQKTIIVSISNPMLECRNTIHVEDYEYYDNNLYLNDGDFELHIELNENTKIQHDDSTEDEYMITNANNNTETRLYFID